MVETKGWTVTVASSQEDDEHWDFLLKKDDKNTKVDVKAMKRINRNDANLQDEYTWIEIHGVRPMMKAGFTGEKLTI